MINIPNWMPRYGVLPTFFSLTNLPYVQYAFYILTLFGLCVKYYSNFLIKKLTSIDANRSI